MKINKNILKISLLFYFFLISCGSIEEAGKVLRNEKIKSTDEFLVEKKEPLTTPPDIFELPEPEQLKKTDNTQNKIQSILNSNESKEENERSTSSAEETILKNIKK